MQDNAHCARERKVSRKDAIVLRERKGVVSECRVSWTANVLQENAKFPRGMQFFLHKD